MGFDPSIISDVVVVQDGPDLVVTWNCSRPGACMFQVYLDHRLAWVGRDRRCVLPIPGDGKGRNVWIDVGMVEFEDCRHNYGDRLESLSQGAIPVSVCWEGGTYLDSAGSDDIGGYHIYRGLSPGRDEVSSVRIGVVPAYYGGWISDGFGLGGFGRGGFGKSASSYEFDLGCLPEGEWSVRIVPFDRRGYERGAGRAIVIQGVGAPRPPQRDGAGHYITYTYEPAANRRLTLRWLPSPSATSEA